MNFKNDHPERRDDEIYLGNFTEESFEENVGYEMKRMGHQAYDIHGNILGEDLYELKPVFINKTEYDAVQAKYVRP